MLELFYIVVAIGSPASLQGSGAGPGALVSILSSMASQNVVAKGKIVVTINDKDYIIDAQKSKFVPMMAGECRIQHGGQQITYNIQAGQIVQLELPAQKVVVEPKKMPRAAIKEESDQPPKAKEVPKEETATKPFRVVDEGDGLKMDSS